MSKQVEIALEAAITSGEVGPQLPGYRELETLLGVSRTVIRPALAALVERGVLSNPGPRKRLQVAAHLGERRGSTSTRKILMLEMNQLGEKTMVSTVIAADLALRAAARNWTVEHTVVKSDQNRDGSKRWQRLLEASGAERLIVVAGARKTLEWACGCGVPTIALGGDPKGLAIPVVGYDSQAMVTIALDRLLVSGHRDICLPLGARSSRFVEEMESAVSEAFARHQVPFQSKLHFPRWHSNTPEAWQEGLQWRFGVRRPDALVLIDVSPYLTSLGVLMKLGLKVPEDLSLVVLAAKSELTWHYPFPASFDLDPTRLSDRIIHWIEAPERSQASQIMEPKWVEGASIRARNTPGL